MSLTIISFLIDSTKLQSGTGGTASRPTPLGHPNMTVDQSDSGGSIYTNIAGNTEVKILANEEVRVLVVETNGLLKVRLAPYGLIVHQFSGGTPNMLDPTKRPIDVPNFDITSNNVPYLAYQSPDTPTWGAVPNTYQNWVGDPMIVQPLNANNAQIYAPFIKFNGSGVVDTGDMEYGVTFVLTRDGKKQDYYTFDPYLLINSPTRGLGRVINS